MLVDFVEGHSTVLPAAEGFDLLLEMCENAKNICGIMEMAEEVGFFLASFQIFFPQPCSKPAFFKLFEVINSFACEFYRVLRFAGTSTACSDRNRPNGASG